MNKRVILVNEQLLMAASHFHLMDQDSYTFGEASRALKEIGLVGIFANFKEVLEETYQILLVDMIQVMNINKTYYHRCVLCGERFEHIGESGQAHIRDHEEFFLEFPEFTGCEDTMLAQICEISGVRLNNNLSPVAHKYTPVCPLAMIIKGENHGSQCRP